MLDLSALSRDDEKPRGMGNGSNATVFPAESGNPSPESPRPAIKDDAILPGPTKGRPP